MNNLRPWSLMQKLLSLILFMSINHYDLNAQRFDIKSDTLLLNIKDIVKPATKVYLTHSVKYKEKYYCFFREDGLYSFKGETKYFLIISNNGKILNNIQVPNDIINAFYFDFFLRNDSLLIKTYVSHESYYFDPQKLTWTKINEIDDKVYEDSNFSIVYLNFGEWGQSTWFIDKQTQKEYVLGVSSITVNFLNGKYYLTKGTEIREIENPLNLQLCDTDYYYPVVEKEKKFYEGSNSLIGSKVIYKDTTVSRWSFEEPKQRILTSFVSNNQLYQLFSDSISTYIGKIEDNKLIPITDLGRKFSTFNWLYSYRGRNENNNSRFLNFEENYNTFGFIEINNKKIDIHYLKLNTDSLKYLGTDGFEKLLNLLIAKKETLPFKQVSNLENKLGGTDMKTDKIGIAHNNYYPQAYNSLNVKTKEFIKIEDKTITQLTEYLFSTTDSALNSIFLEWSSTELVNQSTLIDIFNIKKQNEIEKFKNKQKEIIEIITRQLDLKPKRKDSDNNYFKLYWTLPNLEIVLYGSDNFKHNQVINMIINLK